MFQKAQELVAKMRDLNAFLTTGIQKVQKQAFLPERLHMFVRSGFAFDPGRTRTIAGTGQQN